MSVLIIHGVYKLSLFPDYTLWKVKINIQWIIGEVEMCFLCFIWRSLTHNTSHKTNKQTKEVTFGNLSFFKDINDVPENVKGLMQRKKNVGILVLAQRKLSRVFIKSTLLSLVEKVTSVLLLILYQLNIKHCNSLSNMQTLTNKEGKGIHLVINSIKSKGWLKGKPNN